MTRRSEHLSQELHEYAEAHSTRPDAVLQELAAETAARFGDDAGMQIGPDQGTFMTLLARLTGAASAVEVGTFTGYSAICIARGLAHDGRLLCCDVSEEWTSVARGYWKRAGLDDKIDLRLGPAARTLRDLPAGTSFDYAFIDADKTGYVEYWDLLVPMIRPGGLIRLGAGHQAVQRPRAGRRPGRPRAAADRRRPHHGTQALSSHVPSGPSGGC